MLHGAFENNPHNKPKQKNTKWSDLPPKPDEKDNPIEALRWYLTYSPAIPSNMRMTKQQVDDECARHEAKLRSRGLL